MAPPTKRMKAGLRNYLKYEAKSFEIKNNLLMHHDGVVPDTIEYETTFKDASTQTDQNSSECT